MSRIHLLSHHVISTIAAGEIAERPSIIVKELIENALDAKATEIKIQIDHGGLRRIIISDNGQGMDEEDLQLAVQRHTTSKITATEDLETIATFGFRGEALASVGSVARLTLQSKPLEAEVGYQIVVENSDVTEFQPLGIPSGTTVIVENLFDALPARKKFLKQPATELKHILQVVTATALSHPQIGFFLTHNQNVLLSVPANHTPHERLSQIMGSSSGNQVLELNAEQTYFRLGGFLGKPQLARRSQPHQFLFVNHRAVSHPPLTRLVKEVYGSLIEPKAEPLFVLHLHLPQPLIDVNVHPRKETVKFMDETKILELVRNALIQTLHENDLTYHYQEKTAAVGEREFRYPFPATRDRTMSTVTGGILKDRVTPWHFDDTHNAEILQIHNTYLVAQSPEGLLLVDQHAAHERILFEQFSEAFKDEQSLAHSIALSQPVLFEISLTDAQLLSEHLETLNQLGFEIETFGGQTFKITGVPRLLSDRDPQQLVNELLSDLHQGKPVTGLDTVAERTLAYLACRQAVKAGDPLTSIQRRELLEKLASTTSNFTCPHGRPVSIICDLRELEKMFKRSGF